MYSFPYDIPIEGKISYIDSFFFVASSTTGCGLLTHSLLDLHPYCYVVFGIVAFFYSFIIDSFSHYTCIRLQILALTMLLGNHFASYVPIMIYKRYCYQSVMTALVADKQAGRIQGNIYIRIQNFYFNTKGFKLYSLSSSDPSKFSQGAGKYTRRARYDESIALKY